MSHTQSHTDKAAHAAEKAAKFADAEKKRAGEKDRAVVDNEAERARDKHRSAAREDHVSRANHLRERVESYLGSHQQEVDKFKAQFDDLRKSVDTDDPAVQGVLTEIEGKLNTASKA